MALKFQGRFFLALVMFYTKRKLLIQKVSEKLVAINPDFETHQSNQQLIELNTTRDVLWGKVLTLGDKIQPR